VTAGDSIGNNVMDHCKRMKEVYRCSN
jgi:hypothetical protein